MGGAQSVPERIRLCAKKGDYHALKALLDRLQHEPHFRANPREYLEALDDEGNTPLITASTKGHYQVAELLLQRGASLTTQNSRSEGGSALHQAVLRGHSHIAELLLYHGANPFVENIKGFTAMDLACSTKNVDILRRIETHAHWSGWLSQKVPRLAGFGAEWQRRWVVVCHRIASPLAPPNRQVTHVVLLCYKTTSSCSPVCRVWLDGAQTVEEYNPRAVERAAGHTPSQLELKLHRRHKPPSSGCIATGNPHDGFSLHFRPDEGTALGCAALRSWGNAVNNPRMTPQRPIPRPPQPPSQPEPRPTMQQASVVPTSSPTLSEDPRFSPLGQSATGVVDVSALDAALARRLQTEEDARLAQQLATMPPRLEAQQGSSQEVLTTSPSAPLHPISQPSQDASTFYPQISFASGRPLTASSGPSPAAAPPRERVQVAAAPPPPSPFSEGNFLSGSVAPTALAPSLVNRPGGGGGPAGPSAATGTEASPGQPRFGERECIICCDRPINTEFCHTDQSCAVVCSVCAADYYRVSKNCPKCRQPIVSVKKFYYG